MEYIPLLIYIALWLILFVGLVGAATISSGPLGGIVVALLIIGRSYDAWVNEILAELEEEETDDE